MEFLEHTTERGKAVEIKVEELLIQSEQEALDIMANIGYLYDSRSLKEFILESNRGRQVNFVRDITKAIESING